MIGETILQYKVLEKLGEGGMGTVYKAQDTKLERFVALKFLSSQITVNDDQKARFIQEAKAASAMNHPNVCTIYDIQVNEGQLFIVMEFIDGVTLKNNKQNFSEKKILEVGVQVAEGLAAAHEKGIVHRDIKPENIMIRKDGIVQIMDFGLAKLFTNNNESRLTKMGTTMGTIGYMSPEQVQGLDVDHRTDIFSLGVVLYEMLAGESPFKGMHETAIMYEIVNVDAPPLATVKESISPELDGIILECLEKDKDERFQSAKELAKNLKKIQRTLSASRASRIYNVNSQTFSTKSGQTTAFNSAAKVSLGDIQVKNIFRNIFYNPKLFWSAAGVLFIAVILLLAFSVFNRKEIEVQVIKATILPPHRVNYNNSTGSNITISPDGNYISFIGRDTAGTNKLWIRPVNSLTAKPLTNAGGQSYPFWSPDSRNIAYFYKNKLMKLSISAGTSLPICDAPAGRGGSWNQNGVIVFSPAAIGGLYKVASSGGKPEELIKTDTSAQNGLSLRWPHFLPDGEHFVYSSQDNFAGSSPNDVIFLSSLSDTKSEILISASSNCQYSSGYLLFVRQSVLLAQKFNLDNLKLEGEAMPVSENVEYADNRISSTFAASRNGTLVYVDQSQSSEKTVVLDKTGNEIKKFLDQRTVNSAKFSPDGNKIVYDFYDMNQKNVDVWTYDLIRNVTTRLTFQQNSDVFPRWALDGKKITFSSNPEGDNINSFIKNADGSGEATLLYKSNSNKVLSDISPDGNYLLYTVQNFTSSTSGADIIVLPQKDDKKPRIILSTNFNERGAEFSPNMKWIVYASNEAGKNQIYIIPFNTDNSSNQLSGKWQVSVDQGVAAKWMDNGKKIAFVTQDNRILAVDLNERGSSLSPGKPYEIFKSLNTNIIRILDIDKTGTKIIATVQNSQSIQSPISLISNWTKEIEGKK